MCVRKRHSNKVEEDAEEGTLENECNAKSSFYFMPSRERDFPLVTIKIVLGERREKNFLGISQSSHSIF